MPVPLLPKQARPGVTPRHSLGLAPLALTPGQISVTPQEHRWLSQHQQRPTPTASLPSTLVPPTPAAPGHFCHPSLAPPSAERKETLIEEMRPSWWGSYNTSEPSLTLQGGRLQTRGKARYNPTWVSSNPGHRPSLLGEAGAARVDRDPVNPRSPESQTTTPL